MDSKGKKGLLFGGVACLLIVGVCLFLMNSCQSELDGFIKDIVQDGEVDETEYAQLIQDVKNADSRDREISRIVTNGEVDETALQKFVIRKAKGFGIDSVSFPEPPVPNEPLACKFFLERSGSMFGYGNLNAPGGNFRSAVGQIIMRTQKNHKRDVLYVVNNVVSPTQISLTTLIGSQNPFDLVKEFGDPRITDFSIIFDTLLTRTKKDEVSILVSDLIYSVDSLKTADRDNLLGIEKTVIDNAFRNHPDKDVLVIKCNGGFNGKYYTYSDPFAGVQYKGMRPFYFMIVADTSAMHQLFTDPIYEEFRTFNTLPGYENYFCFTHGNASPSWAVLTKNDYMANATVSTRRSRGNAHDIDLSNPNSKRQRGRDSEAGAMRIVLAIDMSNIYVQPDYLTDPDNYTIKTKGDWTIKEIIKLAGDEDVDRYIMDAVPNATHLIVLESVSGDFKDEKVRISLLNKLPDWISKSSTENDINVVNKPSFSTTTFGLETMMEGIYNAFYPTSDKEKYFDLSLDIKRAKR